VASSENEGDGGGVGGPEPSETPFLVFKRGEQVRKVCEGLEPWLGPALEPKCDMVGAGGVCSSAICALWAAGTAHRAFFMADF